MEIKISGGTAPYDLVLGTLEQGELIPYRTRRNVQSSIWLTDLEVNDYYLRVVDSECSIAKLHVNLEERKYKIIPELVCTEDGLIQSVYVEDLSFISTGDSYDIIFEWSDGTTEIGNPSGQYYYNSDINVKYTILAYINGAYANQEICRITPIFQGGLPHCGNSRIHEIVPECLEMTSQVKDNLGNLVYADHCWNNGFSESGYSSTITVDEFETVSVTAQLMGNNGNCHTTAVEETAICGFEIIQNDECGMSSLEFIAESSFVGQVIWPNNEATIFVNGTSFGASSIFYIEELSTCITVAVNSHFTERCFEFDFPNLSIEFAEDSFEPCIYTSTSQSDGSLDVTVNGEFSGYRKLTLIDNGQIVSSSGNSQDIPPFSIDIQSDLIEHNTSEYTIEIETNDGQCVFTNTTFKSCKIEGYPFLKAEDLCLVSGQSKITIEIPTDFVGSGFIEWPDGSKTHINQGIISSGHYEWMVNSEGVYDCMVKIETSEYIERIEFFPEVDIDVQFADFDPCVYHDSSEMNGTLSATVTGDISQVHSIIWKRNGQTIANDVLSIPITAEELSGVPPMISIEVITENCSFMAEKRLACKMEGRESFIAETTECFKYGESKIKIKHPQNGANTVGTLTWPDGQITTISGGTIWSGPSEWLVSSKGTYDCLVEMDGGRVVYIERFTFEPNILYQEQDPLELYGYTGATSCALYECYGTSLQSLLEQKQEYTYKPISINNICENGKINGCEFNSLTVPAGTGAIVLPHPTDPNCSYCYYPANSLRKSANASEFVEFEIMVEACIDDIDSDDDGPGGGNNQNNGDNDDEVTICLPSSILYPNPICDGGDVDFTIVLPTDEEDQLITIKIYDHNNALMFTYSRRRDGCGPHDFTLPTGANLDPGIYSLELTVSGIPYDKEFKVIPCLIEDDEGCTKYIVPGGGGTNSVDLNQVMPSDPSVFWVYSNPNGLFQITGVSNNNFTYTYTGWQGGEEGSGSDGDGNLSYFATQPGLKDYGGLKAEVGLKRQISRIKQRVNFTNSFSTTPVVIAMANSVKSNKPSVVRVTNVTNDGFDVHVQTEKGDLVSPVVEDIQFFAIETGIGSIDGRSLFVGRTQNVVDDNGYTLQYPIPFNANPILLGAPQTEYDTDPVSFHTTSVGPTNATLMLREQDYMGSGVQHMAEVIGYFILESSEDCIEEEEEEEEEVFAQLGGKIWMEVWFGGVYGLYDAGIDSTESEIIVNLLNDDNSPFIDVNGDPMTTTSDEEGNYNFEGLSEGNYKVEFIKPYNQYSPFIDWDSGDDSVDSDVIDVDGNSGKTAVIALEEGEENLTIFCGFYNPALKGEGASSRNSRSNFTIKCFPNPFKQHINVVTTNVLGQVDIQIYSMGGKLIISDKYDAGEIKIDMSSYNSGVYFLELKNSEIQYSTRIIHL